ncbi:MAG: glycogen synthase [Nitrospirota bacterium]
MKIVCLTNEYPPHIYGGAGIHVANLTRELSLIDGGMHTLHILCFGDQKGKRGNTTVEGVVPVFDFPGSDPRHKRLLDTLCRNILMTGSLQEADIVHCHTWYTHLAGCLIRSMLDIPLIITVHSLEPQRPWKAEQLGTAYKASSWIEQTALNNADGIIAVSEAMKQSVHELYHIPCEKIRTIPNGVDLMQFHPLLNPELLTAYGIAADKPYLLFVGRITRQKGIFHLLNAVPFLAPEIQVVLVAADPDTQEIEREMEQKVGELQQSGVHKVIWINEFLAREQVIPLYSHASVFVCPSIYEPFGIINLEAMACGTPVVASAVGGISEVVVHGETGILVPFEPEDVRMPEPRDPQGFSKDFAQAVNRLLRSPEERKRMGLKAREHVEKNYSWRSVAEQTVGYYRALMPSS